MIEIGSNLKKRSTGNRVRTKFFSVTEEDVRKLEGWKFDWTLPFDNEKYKIFALFLEDSIEYQGLVAYEERPKDSSVKVILIESNPHNIGRNGIYEGTGGHLFAIAIKKSYELGFDGHIYFVSKTNKMDYYQAAFGAKLINSKRSTMAIEKEQSRKLYDTYILGKEY